MPSSDTNPYHKRRTRITTGFFYGIYYEVNNSLSALGWLQYSEPAHILTATTFGGNRDFYPVTGHYFSVNNGRSIVFGINSR
jgi:hypothetical protein